MEIQYVNHGIGNNFGDVIELNVNLKNYPNLHKAILQHELSHVESKPDFVMDITERKIDTTELIKFMIKHPKSLTQFLPVYYTKKHGIVYDINMIITYAVLSAAIGLSLYFGFRYL